MKLKKIAKWLGRRSTEGSTVLGLVIIAGAFGAERLGINLDQLAQGLTLVLGGGLAAATTRNHTPMNEIVSGALR
jgi:hypothetical protein